MIFRKKVLLLTIFILSIAFVTNAPCQAKAGRAQVQDEKARRYVSPELLVTPATNKDIVPRTEPPLLPVKIDVPDAARACQAESECVGVPDVCGSCHCGAAVNQKQYQEYILLRAKVCGATPAISCEAGCPGKKVACIEAKCELVDSGAIR